MTTTGMALHARLLPPPRPKRLSNRWHILPDDMSTCLLDGEKNEADAVAFAADRQQHYYWSQELPAPVRATADDISALPPPPPMLLTAAAVDFYLPSLRSFQIIISGVRVSIGE